MSLPRWKCHKVVEAAPIYEMRIRRGPDGDGMGYEIFLKGLTGAVWIPDEVFARGLPQQGDYLVRYLDQPDGKDYWSWSPKAVFEAGYTREEA